jgi:release factor glutamine methyltransferase
MAPAARDLLARGATALGPLPVDAFLEAAILLAHVIGKPRSWLFAHPEAPVSRHLADRFVAMIEQRATGIPIAYLTGTREFWSLDLHVTPDTLIPRPETELLVERALALPLKAAARVADLGTGSGAVAAALAKERPTWHLIATDTSERALEVAAGNFHRLGLHRVEPRLGSWFEPLSGERFDLILSNPPYVAREDRHLSEGDVAHEPRAALSSGADGLDALRTLTDRAHAHLTPGGWLMVEHGWNQGTAVRELFAAAQFTSVETHRDYAGKERVTGGQAA